ncbi:MAG: hypothetical protein JNM68_14765 [Dinghuibacter sp.]|nr:hypothetical protein [Dinghuibacter sp.]
MSYFKPIFKSRSTSAKVFFAASVLFAGPVSFYLYDFYIQWTQSGHQDIAWYLAFAYDAMGAWGGVIIGMACAAVCFATGYMLHRRRKMYYWR